MLCQTLEPLHPSTCLPVYPQAASQDGLFIYFIGLSFYSPPSTPLSLFPFVFSFIFSFFFYELYRTSW